MSFVLLHADSVATALVDDPVVPATDIAALKDATALLAEHFLRVCCSDDDVGDSWCDSYFDTRVAFLSKLALEKLIELCVEDTVGNELAALADVHSRHRLGGCGLRLHLRGWIVSRCE